MAIPGWAVWTLFLLQLGLVFKKSMLAALGKTPSLTPAPRLKWIPGELERN